MEFAYGQGDDKLNAPDFDPDFARAVEKGLNSLSLVNHLPWLGYPILLARYAPEWVVRKLRMTSFMTLQRVSSSKVPLKVTSAAHRYRKLQSKRGRYWSNRTPQKKHAQQSSNK